MKTLARIAVRGDEGRSNPPFLLDFMMLPGAETKISIGPAAGGFKTKS